MTLEKVKSLSLEELQVRVANLCGWEVSNHGSLLCLVVKTPTGDIYNNISFVPDYARSLEVMHEAEKSLTGNQWIDYIESMKSLLRAYGNTYRSVQQKIHATARQKAEAFVLAMQS